jgi:hypothetical protein
VPIQYRNGGREEGRQATPAKRHSNDGEMPMIRVKSISIYPLFDMGKPWQTGVRHEASASAVSIEFVSRAYQREGPGRRWYHMGKSNKNLRGREKHLTTGL